jgi:hypothetical protein
MILVAAYAGITGAIGLFYMFLGVVIGSRGIGSRLMVGYHKSATADTPAASDPCVPKPWNSQVSEHRWTEALRDWAADDLWYSTMRKLPNPSMP